jgi:hypothetical protein
VIVQIASKQFDPLGYLMFETLPDVRDESMRRRLNKVATLDGGVVVNDGGFAHGDRELSFQYRATDAEQDTIAKRIVELHARVYVSTDDGLFDCVPLSFNPDPDRRVFTFSVVSKEA